MASPEEAASFAVMELEKAEEPTTAWTCPEISRGDTMGSARCCVRGAQLTVQTLDAFVREKVAKAATTERSVVGAMLTCRDIVIKEGDIVVCLDGKEWTGVKPLVVKRNDKGRRLRKKK